MPKQVSENHLSAILQTIEQFPYGASLDNIFGALVSPMPRRSLQRYIALLIKEGRLISRGNARSTRYFLPIKETEEPALISYSRDIPALGNAYFIAESPDLIPLSQAARSIQTHVRQPIQARRPVGYNRDFLDKYRPNETYYLSESIRKHLFEMGKSEDNERPAGTYARHIFNRLLIDLSWNSSRLEGNTYSLLETQRLLQLGETPQGKNSLEAQMILNHKAAIEFMVESAEQLKFDNYTIFNLHALLSDNLLPDDQACGSLRVLPVGIAKSAYHPLAIPQLISENFRQILDTADAIIDPFEQSFFVMVQLPYLQPFLDVNKRVSRLAANIPFIRGNLCPLSFVDVPEQVYVSGLLGIYELNRIELLREVFIWAYERSSALYSAARQVLGEPDLFRLKYRNLLITVIGDIVRGRMDKETAVATIKQKAAEEVTLNHRARFMEVAEIQLMTLHKGNIARFRLKPAEFDEWLTTWK